MNFLLAASEAERAAQQTRIRLLQRERRRLQAELTLKLSHTPARELDLKRTFAAVTIDKEASEVRWRRPRSGGEDRAGDHEQHA